MNRQVPKKTYTIVGDGKVARHFVHYFNLLGISSNQWQRQQSINQLQQSVTQSDVVLLLISDDAIEQFIQQHPFLQNKILIHLSGSLIIEQAIGCHPLMTFGQEFYDLETYQSMPFICDNGVDFSAVFPQLKNQSYSVEPKQKAYYHAMCVMAGNFSQVLMRETSQQLNNQLDLPLDLMFPYLLQNTKNFIANPKTSATGPLERGDITTVQKHLQVLEGNELENIYQSFIEFSSHQLVGFSQPENRLRPTTQLLRKVQ